MQTGLGFGDESADGAQAGFSADVPLTIVRRTALSRCSHGLRSSEWFACPRRSQGNAFPLRAEDPAVITAEAQRSTTRWLVHATFPALFHFQAGDKFHPLEVSFVLDESVSFWT